MGRLLDTFSQFCRFSLSDRPCTRPPVRVVLSSRETTRVLMEKWATFAEDQGMAPNKAIHLIVLGGIVRVAVLKILKDSRWEKNKPPSYYG